MDSRDLYVLRFWGLITLTLHQEAQRNSSVYLMDPLLALFGLLVLMFVVSVVKLQMLGLVLDRLYILSVSL